jgi:hypothetical protein
MSGKPETHFGCKASGIDKGQRIYGLGISEEVSGYIGPAVSEKGPFLL